MQARGSAGAATAAAAPIDEEEAALVARARAGDPTGFEMLMRRNNQRIYRVVRSVLREHGDIEDVIQQAYLKAFLHLDQFGGAARWSTWVCRIAVNEALARLRHQGRFVSMDAVSEQEMKNGTKSLADDPERAAAGSEFGQMVEQVIDSLPEIYRAVLILREVEGMATSEVAEVLEVDPDVVKTRLHRARRALRAAIESRVGEKMKTAYSFGNARCDRVVAAVLSRLNHRS